MSVYFISDTHIGHENMSLKRGFKTVEEHDQFIFDCWNKTIAKRDKVFILGDLTMEKNNYSWLDDLNGTKEIILGNHDLTKHTKNILECETVTKVGACVKYKGMMLTHIPIHTCEIDRFTVNIHGHVHENTLDDKRYINVSCEAVDYTPLSYDEILTEIYLRDEC